MSVNEVYGEFSTFIGLLLRTWLTFPGCGKTQLAHTMAVIAQLPKVIHPNDYYRCSLLSKV
jgi:hypothetical protein